MTRTLAMCALVASTMQARAEDQCPEGISLADLQGPYSLEIGNALVSGDGKTIALASGDVVPVTMDLREGTLYMDAGPNVVLFDWADETDETFDQARFAAISGLTAGELAVTWDCPLERLPMLVGGGLSSSTEGTPIDFHYTFLVMDEQLLVGTLEWSGGGIKTTRLAILSSN